ncbi:nuclear transport factor 2 family protein [Olivibacter sp. CPCC 100613]|uniref:SnoaL-like domain-containing protein n=1 Tax=Sphingobacterium sp. (strain 21) TaxID=743722 RepID=F4CCZ6_SPHS2
MNEYKTTIKSMFKEIFENTAFNEAAIQKYFDQEYIQEVDGKKLNYAQFCKHVSLQKETIRTLSFDFQTIITEGNILFSNHVVCGTTKDGRSGKFRVIAEFHFKDQKIIYCNELTHMISGDEKDRDLGSRH